MKQLYMNNFASALVGDVAAGDGILVVASAAGLPTPAAGDYFLLTLVGLDENGNEVLWEIVKVTARAGTTLTVTRAQEGTTARAWADGALIEARLTAGGMNGKEDAIAAGLSTQYWRGDKSWQDLAAAVRLVLLTGLGAGTNTPIAAADGLLAGLAKLQAQISARAPLDSPVLTGTPKVPTAAAGDNSLLAANTAFVQVAVATAIAALVDTSPAALDTLNELAAALGDDPNFATTMTNALAGKLNATANAVSASKLATARTIALVGEVVAAATAFDGTGNISLTANLSDTGWITPTLVNGWTHQSGKAVQYRKLGPLVLIRGSATNATYAKNNTNAFTLPAGYRPNRNYRQAVKGGAFAAFEALVDVEPDGAVTFMDNATQSGTVWVYADGTNFTTD